MSGNLIDNQINNKYQQGNIQANTGYQANPQTQYVRGSQSVDTTPQTDTFNKPEEKKGPSMPLVMFLTWLGLNKTTDMYNKLCTNDDYNKTIVGRMGNFGDKIAPKIGKSKAYTSLMAHIGSFKSSVKNYINSKPMLYAMFNTATKPENEMVKGFMKTQIAEDVDEAVRTLNGYIDELPKTLKEAGATKDEIKALKAKYGTNIFGQIKNKKRAIQELQFNRIGAAPNFIDTLGNDKELIKKTLQEMKIKHLGLEPDTYKNVFANPEKNLKIIREACKRGGKNAKAFFGRYSWIPGLGFFTKRSTNLSMSYNKLSTEFKHTTKLGKALAKSSKLFMRGLTFGGGRIGSIAVAFGLGTAICNAFKAPKEQKVGTAVAGGVEAVSWIASMPLAVSIMHGINGLANTGLSKMQVGRYRVALRNFNKQVAAGVFKDEAAYKTALEAVNKLREVKVPQGKITKGLSKLGHFLSIALENPKPFQEATKTLKGGAKMSAIGRNIKRYLPLIGKNAIGYPLRFALYALVFSPIVDKVISSATSAIFGKPYEPEETEEGKEAEKNEQQTTTQPQSNPEMPQSPINPNSKPNSPQPFQGNPNARPLDIYSLPDENLIKQAVLGQQVMHGPQYIPDDKCGIPGVVSPYDTVDRSYIPQETAAPIVTNHDADKDIVNRAIADADKAEAKALNTLNGIY